ncbi:hypothetical protein BHU72_10935 [Desulfuribacillus stibiiarsenatis]|uniref:Pro-sigmaK processing inhibitor BofA n=1 Tax=Desulfuribacillus stibiiarsenatis TaxID=1390249 RepID=A0A1E5L2C9_9FIRM|nr:pro-sigmaK processing inhibitor BofA family protein [Desulfuribacillus stibiiarsenatis]OEH84312.1 hypothetical protein BHU72_10935 [Desulfuribacillus stibiiarsenatis]
MYQIMMLAAIAFIGISIVYAGQRFTKPAQVIARLVFQLAVGIIAILAFNLVATPFDVHIAVNPVTALITGYLGIPGFLALLCIHLFIM